MRNKGIMRHSRLWAQSKARDYLDVHPVSAAETEYCTKKHWRKEALPKLPPTAAAFKQLQRSSRARHLCVMLSLLKPLEAYLTLMWQRWLPVHLPGVLLRVNSHGANPQLGAGSEHSDGYLPWNGERRGTHEGDSASFLLIKKNTPNIDL